MVIRPCDAGSDLPALRALYRAAREEGWPWMAGRDWPADAFDRDTEGEAVLVAELDGRVCGFIAIWRPESFVHHLFVLPEAQGHGVGTALLAAGQALCDMTPALKCLTQNVRARDFYLSRGWTVTEEGVGEDGEAFLRMRGPALAWTFSCDKARIDRDLVHRYLSEVSYWAKGLPRDVFERAIDGALCFSVFAPDGQQIAFCRVITDEATFAYLADVFVVDAWRGRGVGKSLVLHLLFHPGLQNLRRFLLATADAHGLYAAFGFKPLGSPDRMMERHNPRVYLMPGGPGA